MCFKTIYISFNVRCTAAGGGGGGSVLVAITYGFPMRYSSFFSMFFHLLVFCLLLLDLCHWFRFFLLKSEHWPLTMSWVNRKPVVAFHLNSSANGIDRRFLRFLDVLFVGVKSLCKSFNSVVTIFFLLLTPKSKFKLETFLFFFVCSIISLRSAMLFERHKPNNEKNFPINCVCSLSLL